MEDTVASTSVTELHTSCTSSTEENQGAGQEVAHSKELEDEASQGMDHSSQEEVTKVTEDAASSAVDDGSLKEEKEHEASSLEHKEEESAVVLENPCHETSESTDPEGQCSQKVDEHEEKTLETPLVEEAIHVDDKPEEQTVVPEGGGGEAGPESECTCTSEDHHAKVEHDTNQAESPSESEIVKATKDSAEEVPSAEHSATETPTITVESATTSEEANNAESPESDASDAPDCHKEHDESQQHAHEEVQSGDDNLPVTTESESVSAAEPDPVKLEEVPEEVKSAEDHSIPETAEPECEGGSDSHKEEHIKETNE